jgi:hypothetical protein
VARWFRFWLRLLPALSIAGALRSATLLRFHIPLIEPDVRISRIGLSDRDSPFRPREVAWSSTQSSKSQLVVQVRVRVM